MDAERSAEPLFAKSLAAFTRTMGKRNKLMYTHYTTSQEHKDRMADLPDHLRCAPSKESYF